MTQNREQRRDFQRFEKGHCLKDVPDFESKRCECGQIMDCYAFFGGEHKEWACRDCHPTLYKWFESINEDIYGDVKGKQ